MKNIWIAMVLAFAATFAPLPLSVPIATASGACVVEPAPISPCLPETNYKGSGDGVADVLVTVCLADSEHASISDANGTNSWVVHYRYELNGSFEAVRTAYNAKCQDFWVIPGTTRVAVYVTCVDYVGWVTTEVITHAGTFIMVRIEGTGWEYNPTKPKV